MGGEQTENLKQVVILRPPFCFSAYEHKLSPDFQLLKVWESPVPVHLFLATHAHSVTVLLCSPRNPNTANLLRLLPSLQLVISASTTLISLSVVDGESPSLLPIMFCRLMSPTWRWAFSLTFFEKSLPRMVPSRWALASEERVSSGFQGYLSLYELKILNRHAHGLVLCKFGS